MSTTLILCFLSGEQNAMLPVLAASIVSLPASSYMPFIGTRENVPGRDFVEQIVLPMLSVWEY